MEDLPLKGKTKINRAIKLTFVICSVPPHSFFIMRYNTDPEDIMSELVAENALQAEEILVLRSTVEVLLGELAIAEIDATAWRLEADSGGDFDRN